MVILEHESFNDVAMKYVIILIAIPSLAFAQDFEFEQELDSIQVSVGEYNLPFPWLGGYSESSPRFCDIDADSTYDLLIGNVLGNINHFKNMGTQYYPNFNFETYEFAGINISAAPWYGRSSPCFGDLDADGDFDLLVGCGNGWVHYYINIGDSANPIMVLEADSLEGVSYFCLNPDLVDIDADGDLDLFGGVWGNISFFENIGTSQIPEFQQDTLNFLNINVGDRACPRFKDIDADGDYDLFIGNRYGKIWYYHNNGSPELYDFVLDTNNWLGIEVGDYASPEFCDIDGDGDYDLFIGKENYDNFTIPGALHYWENIGDPQNPNFIEVTQSDLTFDAGTSTEVDLCDVDLDGDLDLFFQTNAQLGWLENLGTLQTPSFQHKTYNLIGVPPGSNDFADLNGDNYPDLVTADGWGGTLTLWLHNTQPESLAFEEAGELPTEYQINTITLADLNSDGDADLLVGGFEYNPSDMRLVYYENQGSIYQPNFVLITEDYQNIASTIFAPSIIPTLSDVDLDQDYDLLMLNITTTAVYLYENTGGPFTAQFELVSEDFLGYSFYSPPMFDCGDIDWDEDMDVFAGGYEGGIRFFRNVTGQNEVGPKRPIGPPLPQLDLTLGPNPANPVTWISFSLPAPQEATLAVYNILGAKVVTLASGLQMPGTHNVIWNASQYSSGVYIIRLETGEWAEAGRVVVIK